MSEVQETLPPEWKRNDAGELEYIGPTELDINFDPPLMLHPNDPKPVTSIHLTEPTAAHLSAFLDASQKLDEAAAGIAFISANAGVIKAYISRMKARDFNKALAFLGGFTKPGAAA